MRPTQPIDALHLPLVRFKQPVQRLPIFVGQRLGARLKPDLLHFGIVVKPERAFLEDEFQRCRLAEIVVADYVRFVANKTVALVQICPRKYVVLERDDALCLCRESD